MAKPKRKVRTSARRILNTYAELWFGSEFLHRRAINEKAGAYWVEMAGLILAAFTVEAYLNHVGPKIFKTWNERGSHRSKLDIICKKLGLSFPRRERPGRSIDALFRFRNALAHGKSEIFELPPWIEDAERFEGQTTERRPQATWERFCSDVDNVESVRADVNELIRKIHDTADLENDPVFSSGFTSYNATLWEPDRTKTARRRKTKP
jgi:hypothetical protein